MNTLRKFAVISTTVPASTSWYLADLGEARGKQELFTRQSPQRLKTLREHALIESAVSSNHIEGVTVEPGRVRELILGKPLLRDRDEEEVRGYRDALTLIHDNAAALPIDDATIQKLHRLTRGEIWNAGQYKDGDIIERYPDGRERVGEIKAPRGSKTDLIVAAINKFAGEFTAVQLERACPGISRDMIRRVLREQQTGGAVECQGRGPAARWRKIRVITLT